MAGHPLYKHKCTPDHHHHVCLLKTMTKRTVTIDKNGEWPLKKHAGKKNTVIIKRRFASQCQIVSTSSKVMDDVLFFGRRRCYNTF